MSDFLNIHKKTNQRYLKFTLTIFLIFFVLVLIGNIPLLLYSKYYEINPMSILQNDNKNIILIFLLLPFLFGVIIIYLSNRFIYNNHFLRLINSFNSFRYSRFFFSLFCGGVIFFTFFIIDFIFNNENYIFNFQLQSFIILFLISIILIFFQTFFEELFFRGFLFQQFTFFSKSKITGFLVTSFLFGFFHIFNPEVEHIGYVVLFYYIASGLFFTLITILDDGIELALGYHFINNFVLSVVVTNNWSVLQTDALFIDISQPDVSFDVLLPIILIFPFLFYIFKTVYGWKNIYSKFL